MTNNVAHEFGASIRSYWLCEGRDQHVGSDLLEYMRNPLAKITEPEFKWHLADAILNKRFSVEEYERLTDLDFESREEVAADLAQLWQLVFKDAPIELPRQ